VRPETGAPSLRCFILLASPHPASTEAGGGVKALGCARRAVLVSPDYSSLFLVVNNSVTAVWALCRYGKSPDLAGETTRFGKRSAGKPDSPQSAPRTQSEKSAYTNALSSKEESGRHFL